MTTTREQIEERIDQVTRDARETSRKAWLIGLGAVSSVDRQARDLFADLAARGEKLDGKPLELDLMKPLNDANARVKAIGDKVETRFEEGVTRTLHRLGIPARDDVRQLADRVDQLTRKVEGLVA
ncbi:MAG: phasin family protein [Acidobacteriota bacterium]